MAPAALVAQATAPALAMGSAAVGSPVTGTVTFTFTGSTAVGAISVVTQGATGLDFGLNSASPGSCVAQTYTSGTCTVGVTFTPQAAGLRMGAVLLLDGSSNKLAVASISGSGSGATFATDSLVKASILPNEYPSDIVLDASGNVYVSQANTNAYKVTPAGVVTNILGSASYPGAIAVDGAGYIYILDNYNHYIDRTDPASGAQAVLVSGLGAGYGMAFDPQGNLYVSQPNSTTILEYSPSGTLLATINPSVSSQALVFDAAGDLYYAGTSGNVYVIAAGGTTSALVATVSNATGIGALAIDAAGNLYCATQSTNLYEIAAGTHTANAIITVASGTFINGVAVDAAGNLYYGNTNLYKVDRTHPTATLTGTTAIGSTSTEQTVSLRNFGSAASAITGQVASANGKVGPSNTCSAATPVAISATCVASLQFAPVASGSPQNATLNLTGPLTSPVFTLTGYVTGDPVQLGFSLPPAATLISGNSPGTVTVAIQDHAGTTVPAQADSLTLTITGPTTPAPMTVAAVNGVATFNLSATTLTTVGTYTYTVTDNTRALASTATTQVVLPKYFTVVPANLTITASAADSIAVTAYDNAGNLATGYAGYVALTSTDAAATLPAAFSLASGQGSGNVTFNTAGNQTVKATDMVSGLVTGTSATIVVQPLPVYTVTVMTDPATGTAGNCTNQALSGATADAGCSLRDAVAAVNALAITGTTGVQPMINFATGINGHTITVTAPLVLTANVNIAGPGPASVVTISGGGTTGILQQNTASTATSVSGLTLSNGSAVQGAAFYSVVASAYTFTNDVFSGNGSNGSAALYGGALYLTGTPTVVVAGCSFVNNKLISTSSLAYGGAIYQSGGSLAIRNSPQSNTVFSGNQAQATTNAYGGALAAVGLLSGGLTISGASFLGNTAKSSATATYLTYGGAAYIQSTNGSTVVSIANSLFSNNTAAGQYTTYGGALYLVSGAVTTTGSTFYGNTVTFNTATNSSARYGGAIYSTVATTLYNDTITLNSAQGTAGRGGGVYAGAASTAYNTVISGNTASSTYVDEYFVSGGSNNYIDNSATHLCSVNCAPLLSALGNYGGPVQTMVPLPGSPLLAAGLASKVNGAAIDGRGTMYPRTLSYNGGAAYTDIGAVTANYSLSFVTQPTTTGVNSALLPPPTVQLYESGVPFGGTGGTLAVAAQSGAMFTTAADSTAYTSVATVGSGLESIAPYFSSPQAGDALIVSVQNGATTVASTTSGTFNIGNTTAASLTFRVAPPTAVTTGGNAGTVQVALTSTGGATNTSATAAVTLTVTSPGYSRTYGPTAAVQGVVSFNLSGVALTTAGSYTYTASAAAYTTDTVVATETVGGNSVWVVDASGVLVKLSTAGALVSTVGTAGTTASYGGVAFNSAGDLWSVNTANNALSFVAQGDGTLSSYTGGGLNAPVSVAVDGAGYVWVANSGNNTVSEFTNGRAAMSPAVGYGTSAALNAPSSVGIDSAGGVWIANRNGNSVTHIFGAATPVVTPLAAGTLPQ